VHAPGYRQSPQTLAHSPGIGRQLLGFFGVGRAPLTIVVGSLMIGWGLFGLGATELLRPVLRIPVLFAGPALLAALLGALCTAKLFGEIAALVMPKEESYAIRREGLIGLTGKVIYPVSATAGRVHVYDPYRTLHAEPARTDPGQAPLDKGMDVIVASIDPEHGYLIVEPLGFRQ
jgi:hypothetical protein